MKTKQKKMEGRQTARLYQGCRRNLRIMSAKARWAFHQVKTKQVKTNNNNSSLKTKQKQKQNKI